VLAPPCRVNACGACRALLARPAVIALAVRPGQT